MSVFFWGKATQEREAKGVLEPQEYSPIWEPPFTYIYF